MLKSLTIYKFDHIYSVRQKYMSMLCFKYQVDKTIKLWHDQVSLNKTCNNNCMTCLKNLYKQINGDG